MHWTIEEGVGVTFPKETITAYYIGNYDDYYEQLDMPYIVELCKKAGWSDEAIEVLEIRLDEEVIHPMESFAESACESRENETAEDYYG